MSPPRTELPDLTKNSLPELLKEIEAMEALDPADRKTVLLQLLQTSEESGWTILMLDAYCYPELVPEILKAMELLDPAEHKTVLMQLMQPMKPIQLSKLVVGGMNLLMIAAHYNPGLVPELLKVMELLDPADRKTILMQINFMTRCNVLMLAAYLSPELVPEILKAMEVLDPADRKTMLMQIDEFGGSVLMIAAHHNPGLVPDLLKAIGLLNLVDDDELTNEQLINLIGLSDDSRYAKQFVKIARLCPEFFLSLNHSQQLTIIRQAKHHHQLTEFMKAVYPEKMQAFLIEYKANSLIGIPYEWQKELLIVQVEDLFDQISKYLDTISNPKDQQCRRDHFNRLKANWNREPNGNTLLDMDKFPKQFLRSNRYHMFVNQLNNLGKVMIELEKQANPEQHDFFDGDMASEEGARITIFEMKELGGSSEERVSTVSVEPADPLPQSEPTRKPPSSRSLESSN